MAVSHVFYCDQCHAEAGRITLFGRGEVIPGRTGGSSDEVMSHANNSSSERPHLQVLSGVENVKMFEFDVGAALAPVGIGDARALDALDREFVPFWCPRCDASYCGQHWVTWDLFDDGFFDEKRGRCPASHERRLLD